MTTQKVRLLVHDVTCGGGPTQDIVTAGGQTGPHQMTLREIELYGPFGQSAPVASGPLRIGFLGDSITYGVGDGGGPGCYDWALTDLAKNGYQPTGVNYGSNGASVASFYQQMGGPLGAFEAAGVSVVSLMLGTNDAQVSVATSPQDYHDKLLSIISSLLAPGTGIHQVILNYSPFIQPGSAATWDGTADARLQSFQAQIDSLCNGTTILQGDKLAFSFFQQHPEQGDGVHPNPQGHQDLGDLWAIAITNALGGTNTLPYPTGTVPASGAGTVRFFPRSGCASRMVGGQFQGSADGVSYTTLYTISAVPADGQWTSAALSADPKSYRYLRYLSPNGGWGNVAEIVFYSGTGTAAVKLTGTPFGTPGSYAGSGNTYDKAFDGDTTSYFDGPGPNGNYTGIDQGGSPAPAPALTPVYQISAGGPSCGTFAADEFVQGGSADTAAAAVDVSAAATPAPAAVYQSERWGSFTYTLPNLTPGAAYTLRLHFAETFFGPGLPGGGGAGSRLFNVAVNGSQVLGNFDIFAAAGGANKAVEKSFPATADANGNVTVAFTTGSANFAKLSGLELLH